jgi:hypothetical protein
VYILDANHSPEAPADPKKAMTPDSFASKWKVLEISLAECFDLIPI